MSLPQKDKRYEYPRDVQSEVWRKWFAVRQQKNCIVKMNTGSGKTVVGLVMLQSCLNEEMGPAAYIVPDKYLVTQVCEEAQKLGIQVTQDRDDYLYSEGKSILVMPIQALANGKSVFGMRSTGNYPLGSVLIDDVHVCLDTISAQFSIKISSNHELYHKIVSVFSDDWKEYNLNSYINIVEMQDPTKNALIPFWMWQEKTNEVLRILYEYNNDREENKKIFFSLPLLGKDLSTCNCIISPRAIEITPLGIAIENIRCFKDAKRRIFMSATLSDDSVFISNIGLDESEIRNIITPDNANDLGDRLILFPRHLSSEIKNEDIKSKLILFSEKYNVIVIVPSTDRAYFWDETRQNVVTEENIEDAVSKLKHRSAGLTIFVNRYDGIDLPDDACRILVIDGLPPLRSEYEKYIQSIDESSNVLLREQVQRIEQGMGRGVRSNSDSCCIVLMGDDLTDTLVRNKGTHYFSSATMEQYTLSKELWDLLKQEKNSPSVDDIFELAEFSLNRELEWIQKSKERLSNIKYQSQPKFDKVTVALRKAFEFSRIRQWKEAADEIDKVSNSGLPDSTKGYLLQLKAGYINFVDQTLAQQILLAAHTLNTGVLSPIEGIQYNKCIGNVKQAHAVCEYIRSTFQNSNDFIVHIDAITTKLAFSDDANGFESALAKLGNLLGFLSTRPDKETNGAGPDNLWAIGNGDYFIIECKTGATSNKISKEYCNQLGGSVRWFKSEYDANYSCTPLMIHNSIVIDLLATPLDDMRIMDKACMEKMKKQIKAFAVAMTQNENWLNETKINELLKSYHLRGSDIAQRYTVQYKKKM